MEFILNISTDISFFRINLNSIPDDCTILRIKENYKNTVARNEKQKMLANTTLDTYRLNQRLKELTYLKVLDLSGCSDIISIQYGFSNLSVDTIIMPPKVKVSPQLFQCPNLLSVIGKGLRQISKITYCPKLEFLEFDPLLDSIYIPNTSIRYLSLPNVREISSGAFENCRNLTVIEFSSNIKKIGINSFKNCESLYSINLPDSCVEIGNDAFCGCTSLQKITLPNVLRKLKQNTFYNCVKLETVTGGKSISELAKGSFYNCISLKQLPFTPQLIDKEVFENIHEKLFGIVMSTYETSIIWCFDNLQFYYCDEKLPAEKKHCLVSFRGLPRFTTSCDLHIQHISINQSICQYASNIVNISTFDDIPYKYRDAVEKLSLLQNSIPDIDDIIEKTKAKILSLDIKHIINSYRTFASEYQTTKNGGDNTFYHIVESSIDYSDCYLEQFLPKIKDYYYDSAYMNFSDEIDSDIQEKYNISDEKKKNIAMSEYNIESHTYALVNGYIKKLINDKLYIECVLHIELAQKILDYYFKYIHLSYSIESISIVCGGCTPELDIEKWLINRRNMILNKK